MDKFSEIKTGLLDRMQSDIRAFLDKRPELDFYCFAFDCNSEYAEILMCFNTEGNFQKTLEHYRNGRYKDYYRTAADIFLLRYNTGDWAFRAVADYRAIDECCLASLYGNYIDLQRSQIMKFNYDLLSSLCQTEAFESIPKTADFKILCIDHDEDPDEAMENTEKYVVWRK